MAGRLHIDDWTRHPSLAALGQRQQPRLSPNVAPRQWVSILRRDAGSTRLCEAFWGLTPDWLGVLDHAPHCARAESLESRSMFREAFATRRCVVPVTGVFVWQQSVRGKQPYLVTQVERAPLLLAGLWTRYLQDHGPARDSFALITVPTSTFLGALTDRLPAIVPLAALDTWLAEETPAVKAREWLTPAPPELLGAFPVSKRINDPAHQDWACAYPTGAMQVWSA